MTAALCAKSTMRSNSSSDAGADIDAIFPLVLVLVDAVRESKTSSSPASNAPAKVSPHPVVEWTVGARKPGKRRK